MLNFLTKGESSWCAHGNTEIGLFAINLPTVAAAILSMAAVFGMAAVVSPTGAAQTYTVIHNFTGGPDGAAPMAGLTMDRAGNLYGTAAYGGNFGGDCGANGCGRLFGSRTGTPAGY